MMKKTLAIALLFAGVASAFAQKTPAKPAPKPATISCAVMKGDMIDPARAVKMGLFTDYKGKRYVFCCPGCKPKFDKDPAKYAKTAPSIPIPAKKKA